MTRAGERREYEALQLERRKVDALEAIAHNLGQLAAVAQPVKFHVDPTGKAAPQRVQVQVDEHDREPAMRPPVEPMGPGD